MARDAGKFCRQRSGEGKHFDMHAPMINMYTQAHAARGEDQTLRAMVPAGDVGKDDFSNKRWQEVKRATGEKGLYLLC